MANEPKKTVAVPPALPGAKAGTGNPAPVAQPARHPVAVGTGNGAAPAQPAPVAAPAVSKPELFGGHRGGGKKRSDGLIAGSPEAIEADRKKNAERMRLERAAKKNANLPPALPRVAASAESEIAPPADAARVVPVAPLGAAGSVPVVAGAAPMFVAWQQRVLEKPAKLLGKILDRWRSYKRAAQVKRLHLSPSAEKEILDRMAWRAEVLNDFAVALSETTTTELNKRMVPGAEHSHWINLAMSAGELVYLEINNSQTIESLILEDRKNNPPPDEHKA